MPTKSKSDTVMSDVKVSSEIEVAQTQNQTIDDTVANDRRSFLKKVCSTQRLQSQQ